MDSRKKIGRRVKNWAAKTLIVPPGHDDSGKPLILPPYIVRFFDAAFQPGVIEAGLSLPRGQVKTTGAAVLLLYFMVGPGYKAGWRAGVMATTGAIATQIKDLIMSVADASGLPVETRFTPQPGRIVATNGDAEIQFVHGGSRSAHLGAGYDLFCCDEMGEMEERLRRQVGMAQSSCAKRGGLFIGTGVRAFSPLFEDMRSRGNRPTTVWHEYAGKPGKPVDNVANIKRANPAIGAGIMPLENVLAAGIRAKGNPAEEFQFRAYHLNLPGQPKTEMLLTLAEYERHVVTDALPPRDGLCSLGVDIGYSESMTAACAYWSATGRLEVYTAIPSEPSLHERGLSDGVGNLYVAAHDRGELEAHPGLVTDVHYFMSLLAGNLAGEAVEMVADDYRKGEVIEAMRHLGLYWPVDFRRVGRGRDSLRDIIETQKLLKGGAVKVQENLLLANAIRFATLRFSSSNNFCELVKYKSNSRIDAASALVLAIGHGARVLAQPEPVLDFFVA